MTRRSFFLLQTLLLVGCSASVPPEAMVVPAGIRLNAQPASDHDELPATLSVDLQLPARSTQALPGTWDTATLRLEHASVLTDPRQKTLIKGAQIVASGSTYVATAALGGGLRPQSGYTLTVDLWNGGAFSSLVGEKQVTVNLVAGPNAVTVPMIVYPAFAFTSFSPATGSPGTSVTLNGQGFSVLPSITQATFGTAGAMQAITPSTLTSTTLSTTVPSDMSPGGKTWQVQVGTSVAFRTGFTVVGMVGNRYASTSGGGQQQDPAVAYGNNQYLSAWTDSRATSGAGIYGVRMSTTGSVTGSEIVIANLAAQSSKPAIAYDSTNNRYLVAFESNNAILGQIVKSDGTLLGGTITLGSTTGTRGNAKVAYDPTNLQYLVVWEDSRAGTNVIYGQRLASDGSLIGGNVSLVSVASVAQSRATVAYSAIANKFLVASTSQSSPMQVAGRLINPDGTAGGSVLTIGSGANNQTDPAVAVDAVSGDFFVVWDGAVTGFRDHIMGQRVSKAGSLVGGAVTINSVNSLKEAPHVAYEPARGTFLVTWGDNRSTDTDLYAVHVGLDGAQWGSEFPVASQTNIQTKGEVAVDPTSRRGLVLYEETVGATKKVYGHLTYH